MNSLKLQILLADDDEEDCMFFEEALRQLPLATQLTTVKDGMQLMMYLCTSTNRLPDILFLDLNMPVKNGFECLEEIKRNESLKLLPVFLLSNSRQQNIINLLYQIGAEHFIRKSGDFEELKKMIHMAINIVAEKKIRRPAKEAFVLNDFVLQ